MKADNKINRINNIFFDLVNQIIPLFDGEFSVRLVLDDARKYPKTRDYAMSSVDTVFIAPKILEASKNTIEGLLMHELAHVYLMKMGIHEHSELQTDQLAELIFDKKIYYDNNDIQTTKGGKYPRPDYLPKK